MSGETLLPESTRRPWKIDPISSREVIAGRTAIAYVHDDLVGRENANVEFIVRAANAHDRFVAALTGVHQD